MSPTFSAAPIIWENVMTQDGENTLSEPSPLSAARMLHLFMVYQRSMK